LREGGEKRLRRDISIIDNQFGSMLGRDNQFGIMSRKSTIAAIHFIGIPTEYIEIGRGDYT